MGEQRGQIALYKDEIDEVVASAKKKEEYFDENPFKYFMLAVIAGFFVIVGIAIAYTIGGMFFHMDKMYGKLGVALTFSIALDLIYFAGSELFTGNNFILGVALYEGKMKVSKVAKILFICFLGNFAGIIVFSLIYVFGGAPAGHTTEYIMYASAAKVKLTPIQSVLRGILCNFVVCLAVWISIKMKEETAKVIVIFWCILAFCIAGFEHCIANLAVFFIALISPDSSITVWSAVYSTFWVTIGNMIGGAIFLGFPYWFVSKTKNKK